MYIKFQLEKDLYIDTIIPGVSSLGAPDGFKRGSVILVLSINEKEKI